MLIDHHSQTLRRSAISMAVALLVCLVVTASSPRLAEAGCGDHLRWVPRSDVCAREVPFDVLWEQEMNSESPPGEGPAPCHGPHCSQRSLPAPSPARVLGPERQDGCLLGLAISAAPQSALQAPAQPISVPICAGARVFRPPR